MCAIFGALVHANLTSDEQFAANVILKTIWKAAHDRGRDGRGYLRQTRFDVDRTVSLTKLTNAADSALVLMGTEPRVMAGNGPQLIIGNTRAEPTTEYVDDKRNADQQPYVGTNWSIVHNGTIANDKELRTMEYPTEIDSAAVLEQLEKGDLDSRSSFIDFVDTIGKLKGSFAILATRRDRPSMFVAANYRPVWFITTTFGTFFASTRDSFLPKYSPKMIEPYTVNHFDLNKESRSIYHHSVTMHVADNVTAPKALVICSGGLDSVVSAVYAQRVMGLDVELMHFHYGSRAATPELTAIKAVAEHMGVKLHVKMLPMWDTEDSPLLQADSAIAGGEQGAEFAHEWVPARNLVMLAVATAYAEAKGFSWLVLGNNLEEAGAYPDNEPEFIAKFNDLLPFAVGDGKFVKVIMPVGNMMKHEIVDLGHRIGAPMHLTWSCYRAGALHCGKCGPCFMRRTAFEINKLPEVIEYAE